MLLSNQSEVIPKMKNVAVSIRYLGIGFQFNDI